MAATQIVSHVVPFPQSVPAKPAVITQDRLTHFLALQQRIEALEVERNQIETELRSSLDTGAAVEPGIFRAYLKTTERRNVSWKEVVERQLGKSYAKRVLAATKPDPITRLIVEA
jgi:hypothetical protein